MGVDFNADSKHLWWIHDRIVNVYGESENVDFLIKMREIIKECEASENGLRDYLDYRRKKNETDMVIGQIYNLDLGGSCPVRVKPIEFISETEVICEYLNSYAGRKEILPIELFPKNG